MKGATLPLALIVAFVLGWHSMCGPGAAGKSPLGTAEAILRTVADPRCAGLIEERFPELFQARALCAPDVAGPVRFRRVTRLTRREERWAEVTCWYGST